MEQCMQACWVSRECVVCLCCRAAAATHAKRHCCRVAASCIKPAAHTLLQDCEHYQNALCCWLLLLLVVLRVLLSFLSQAQVAVTDAQGMLM